MPTTSTAQAASNAKASRAAIRELEKRRAMQKIKMDQQMKEKQKEAVDIINKFCDEFDKDGDGDLDPGEIKELLRQTSKTPPSETALSEAVAKVPSEGIKREHLPAAYVKIRGYLDQQIYIDKTFAEFDEDGSGYIGRVELEVLMTRMAGGTSGEKPSENDIDFVLKKCDVGAALENMKNKTKSFREKAAETPDEGPADADSDGCIDRNEILPVISLWKTVLIERAKGHDPVPPPGFVEHSSACVVS